MRGPAVNLLYFGRGGTVFNVLVIAEKQTFGACLEESLQGHGYIVKVVDSYGSRDSEATGRSVSGYFALVIATNTLLLPAKLQDLIPDIRAQHPHARILVLSGYYPEDFVAELRQKGTDAFLPLPYQEDALLTEVAGLLASPERIS